MPNYSYTNLEQDVRRDASSITNIRRILNRAVREVVSDSDLRSTKRRTYTTPFINDEQYAYTAPGDLKESALIDVRRIADRRTTDKLVLTTTEYFDRNKKLKENLVCVEDQDFRRVIRVSAYLRGDSQQTVIHNCDSITENGTWSVAADASGLNLDDQMFLEGTSSLRFTMDSGGTTTVASGAIVNSDIDAVNLVGYSTIFAAIYAPTIGTLDGFTLRVGNDASNYMQRQVTTTSEGLTFQTGWMQLRFELAGATETGTFAPAAIDYVRLSIDRDTGALTSNEWRLDHIIARNGVPHEIWYYSKFGWQNAAGKYLENSTVNGDLLNADVQEYQLFILKGKELISEDLERFDEADKYRQRYEIEQAKYQQRYPSERMLMIMRYYEFGSRDYNTDSSELW